MIKNVIKAASKRARKSFLIACWKDVATRGSSMYVAERLTKTNRQRDKDIFISYELFQTLFLLTFQNIAERSSSYRIYNTGLNAAAKSNAQN